ncbi:MAG: sulfatase-like hydrolase/transferase [Ardenticatenaceae bacterium]|nr:sulfatase-like hydrolase/transferase [Ardenticatenaceae bacterium]
MKTTLEVQGAPSGRRAFYGGLFFYLFLFAFEEYFFDIPHLRYIVQNPPETGGYRPILLLFAGNFGTFAAIWISARSKLKFRLGYFLIFGLITIIQYGYWHALNRPLSLLDVHTGLSSSFDLWIDAAIIFASPWALIPILSYGLLLLFTVKDEYLGWKGFLTVSTFVLLFFSLLISLNYHLPFMTVPKAFNVFLETVWVDKEITQYERMTIPFQSSTPPLNNVILIIDESVRGDSLSLNGYPRPTTPYLEELAEAGFLHNWGIAVSAATCSIPSNAAIISGLSSLPDPDQAVYTNPTLFHYAKVMGYQSWYVNAQSSIFWNSLQDQDILLIDHRITPFDLGHSHNNDFVAAEKIREIVTASTGNFILVNKLGVHFPYHEAYPEESTIWSPINTDHQPGQALINAYDNAVSYNIDTFFEKLLQDDVFLENTIIVYTSDHGQTLGQVNGQWPHCGGSRIEAMVPLFLIGDIPNLDTSYPASHFNIFPTILDLMNFPADERPVEYSLSLLQATGADQSDRYFLSKTEGFLNGEVVNFDSEPPLQLKEIMTVERE